MKKKLYVICNSHIDPVWLWRRCSGRSSWLNTIHSVVRLMKKYKEMKYTCSSSALYRWIEETNTGLFQDISSLITEGRWEIVGGWEVQSDVIIGRPETLLQQAAIGKSYFMEKFGVDVKTAYNPDAFGHSAFLPKILKLSGFENYVFMRGNELPGLFRWKSDDNACVTGLKIAGSYNTVSSISQNDLNRRFEFAMKTDLDHQTVFLGIGDHGGEFSEKQLKWILEAQKDYDIAFSTLQEYFSVVKDLDIPEYTGEIGPVFRGCYSNCHEVKRLISEASDKIRKAESLGVGRKELESAWKELCFNHFHDILPGTSIRSAYQKDVFPGLGFVIHSANELIDKELARCESAEDLSFMQEGGIQVWNPHPFANKAIVSFEGFCDPNASGENFNALFGRDGSVLPLQILPAPTSYGPCGVPWGCLTAVISTQANKICFYACGRTEQKFEKLGCKRQYDLLKKLSFAVFHDATQTWGFNLSSFLDFEGEPEQVSVIEWIDGPVCSILKAEYQYKHSAIEMQLIAYTGIPEIKIQIQTDWHERKSVLKLCLKHGLERSSFYTGHGAGIDLRSTEERGRFQWKNGETVKHFASAGEFSMIDWCAVSAEKLTTGFYAADLHSCDHEDGTLRLTLLRTVLYADHYGFMPPQSREWHDLGISDFSVWYLPPTASSFETLPRKAASRLIEAEAREVTRHSSGKEYICPIPEFSISSENIVMDSVRLLDNGKVQIHLYNHGDETSILLPGGKHCILGKKSLKEIIL